MKFGGVDPSIIRELSGIYKPFTQAFKEIISNSYDAGAENVKIRINASIMPGKIIGENSIIGAQTLINEDVAPNTLWYQDLTKGFIKKRII